MSEDSLVDGGEALPVGAEAAADVHGLTGGQQLVGQDGAGVLQDLPGLAGRRGAHGHEILLVGGGGDGVHAGGVSQHLVLRCHGGGGVLHDHIAAVEPALGGQKRRQPVGEGGVHHALGAPLGNAGQLRAGDAQKVKGQGHGLAVEVAARDDGFVL